MQDVAQVYSFGNYKFVLNEGLKTNVFDLVNDLDFATLLGKIDLFYSSFDKNKYADLIEYNKPINAI